MRDSWYKLVDRVLRPARPRLEHCRGARKRHLDGRRHYAEEQARTVARCQARIEAARADVFAARDGVVTSRMTDLEREWRRLSRSDPDRGLMDLWARLVPGSWIDRKRWRDSDPAARLDAAIALAADVEGVEAAEAATDALRRTLAGWGTCVGARVRWRAFEHDFDGIPELLAKPLHAASEALSSRDGASMIVEHARRLERDVHEIARRRFPKRAHLVRALAHAAFVDCVWRAASLAESANPVTSLRALWTTGYVLSAIDEQSVTLELPAL